MNSVTAIKPFLKWAGGKRRLLKEIIPELPRAERLVEPFTGSAAVFLGSDFNSYLLADSNADLINLYQSLKSGKERFIKEAREYFSPVTNTADSYYELRASFNATNNMKDRSLLFLYLNRHGFNGLCRYNGSGMFNTPFGKYNKPYFPEKEMRDFIKKCSICDVTFKCCSFEETFAMVGENDAVYCDPPYCPLSNTANFTSYVTSFTYEDQQRLALCAETVAKKGAHVLISNHDLPFTRMLYKNAEQKKFPASRTISCKGNGRHQVMELLAVYRNI